MTHTVPIYEGYSMPHAVQRVDMAGRDLTEHMQKLLLETGLSLMNSSERETCRAMKEQLCYVALDYEEELAQANKSGSADAQMYELPDGSEVTVGDARFRCPEALFRPAMLGKEALGMPELVVKTIQGCDMDVRRELYSNIVLSGGTTMYKGLAERLAKDLSNLTPAGVKPKVVAPPERKYSVWIGGSILSSLTTFQNQWITKREYDECGPSIVHNKCI